MRFVHRLLPLVTAVAPGSDAPRGARLQHADMLHRYLPLRAAGTTSMPRCSSIGRSAANVRPVASSASPFPSRMRSVVRLTASATSALPRWLLLAICIIYASFGLFGRDPWKNEDAAGFGVMWTMANGDAKDWLLPNLVGKALTADGPLMYWLGALSIRAAEPVGRCEQCVARRHGSALLSRLRVRLVFGLSARPARRSAAVQIRVRRRTGTARLRPHARRRRAADPARLLRPRRARPRNHAAARAIRRHRDARLRPRAQHRQADPGRAHLGRGDRRGRLVEQPGAGLRAPALHARDDDHRAAGAAAAAR